MKISYVFNRTLVVTIIMTNKPTNALAPVITVFILFCCLLGAPLSRADDSRFGNSAANERLQWILAVPDAQWNGPTGKLAALLDKQEYAAADELLAKWLENDFYNALLALPSMQHFSHQFDNYAFESIYVESLKALKGGERLEHLAQLDLANEAVFSVGVSVLSDWWANDPSTMMQWVLETPGFSEIIYLEGFIERSVRTQNDLHRWVELLWKLDEGDIRKERFLGELFSELIESNLQRALKFATDTKKSRSLEPNSSSDQIAFRLAYHLSEHGQPQKALHWLSQVESKETRELAIRDLIFNCIDINTARPYIEWLGANQVQSMAIRDSIDQYVLSLKASGSAKPDED